MVVDKVHEMFSFEQGKWLEKYLSTITQKRKQAVKDLKKISMKY